MPKENRQVTGGRKGGKAKVPKGLAILKRDDPEAFKQYYVDMWAKRRAKTVDK